MVTLNTSTLRSNIFETLYDELTAANLLSSTATVTAAYIDSEDSFPQVVINPVDIEKTNFSFDRSNSNKSVTILIDIWTKKNKDKDLLTDEIDTIVSAISWSGSLTLAGWSESNALESPSGNKVHLKSIALTFFRG